MKEILWGALKLVNNGLICPSLSELRMQERNREKKRRKDG